MLNRFTTLGIEFMNHRECPRQSQRHHFTSRYKHLLVPTNLTPADLPAVLMGLELASIHESQLTLLHVLPAAEPEKSLHWLDAIDQLHQAWKGTNGRTSLRSGTDLAECARAQFQNFIETHVPAELRDEVDVCLESRVGEVAETIARYAHECDADLVIMSCGRLRWWRLFDPDHARRVAQLLRRKCVLILSSTPTIENVQHAFGSNA